MRSAACSSVCACAIEMPGMPVDRKSTRLNSSHGYISYAVFCLKKKKKTKSQQNMRHDLKQKNFELTTNLGSLSASDPEKGKHLGYIYAYSLSVIEQNTREVRT